MSAAPTVDLIKSLRAQGWDVTGERSWDSCSIADREADARGLGRLGKIQPPIRSEKDRARLWAGIREGRLSIIGTGCVLYIREQKLSASFWDAPVRLGPALRFTLPIMYSRGVNSGQISLEAMARLLAENAVRRWGLYPTKGVLQLGSGADVIVIDPHLDMTLGLYNYRRLDIDFDVKIQSFGCVWY